MSNSRYLPMTLGIVIIVVAFVGTMSDREDRPDKPAVPERVDDKPVRMSLEKMRATNCSEAGEFIQHHYRAGWKI